MIENKALPQTSDYYYNPHFWQSAYHLPLCLLTQLSHPLFL